MTSILTNNGAMVALQTLKSINNDLGTVQEQISTGKKVGTAKDNAATWAISKTMEADVSSFNQISEGLSVAGSTVAVARDAAETTTDLLQQMKDKITQAQTSSNDEDRAKINDDVTALKEQIGSVIGAAQFNGVNLIDGSQTTVVGTGVDADNPAPTGLKVLSSLNRGSDGAVTPAYIGVEAQNLSELTTTSTSYAYDATTGAATPTENDAYKLSDVDVSTAAKAEEALTAIDAMIETAANAAASFGTSQNQIETQNDFVGKLTDNLKSGIGAMVDADMEEASARLQALQTQQQLGIQSLSIANQAPGSVMALFR